MLDQAIELIKADPENWCWVEQAIDKNFVYKVEKIVLSEHGIVSTFDYVYNFAFTYYGGSVTSIVFSLFPARGLGFFERRRLYKALKEWASYQLTQSSKSAREERLIQLRQEANAADVEVEAAERRALVRFREGLEEP